MNRLNKKEILVRDLGLLAGVIVLGAMLVVGCSSSSSSPKANPQPSTYDGTFTGAGGANGTISLTITPPAAAVQPALMPLAMTTDPVSGTIHLVGGATIDLTGTFTPPTGPLNASGGGYTLTGTLQNGVLSGTITGPGGSGKFTSLVAGGTTTVTIFCGTFAGSNSGTWNLALSGTTLTGSATNSGGSQGSTVLTGTLNGSTVSLTFSNGTATGTLDGTTMSGTWMTTDGSGKTGTWMGSSTACN